MMKTPKPEAYISAQWSAPKNVHALTTTREGGCSLSPFDSLNLGDHVGDDELAVAANRQGLLRELGISSAQWLQQVHGVECIAASIDGCIPQADACWTDQKDLACVVMTADCLPVFFCNTQGSRVAVAHAGWRGLLDGVLEKTLSVFSTEDQVVSWLGPAIGPAAFEVGAEVRQQFIKVHAELNDGLESATRAAFTPVEGKDGKFLADIYQLAALRLQAAGINQVASSARCTYTESSLFYSYRRDGQTGRLASLIWLD